MSPGRLNATVDSQIEAIVRRALRPDPGERYRTAGEMLRDLDVWQPGGHKDGHAELAATLSGRASKEILGTRPPLDNRDARSKAQEALRLAREAGRLIEAADLMEEAFIDSPPLREQYENRVRLWRRGVAM
jgi:serine/threonine-protein kinase